ncbi:hypothetical protein GCM10023169_38890 [Georgenia halophila]|uniref:Glycosidase n=2 Tax=Georgenia halophila TaxID=620889 RepID=A0ABP8LNL1_9MICO
MSAEISHVARLGATAVEIRVPEADPDEPGVSETVDKLIHRVHQRSLRFIVSLAGLPGDVALERGRSWLDRGVDGLDLGVLDGDAPIDDVRALHALAAEREVVLTAAASAARPEALAEHLHEHWLHVTRDDRLGIAAWDAAELRASISDAYLQRAAVGAPAGWMLTELGADPWGLGADAASRRRRRAATLIMLALPGTVYLHQGEAVGVTPRPDDPAGSIGEVAEVAAEQRGTPGSPFEQYRDALRLRSELRLGTGPLAWIDDAPSPDTLALLTRDLMVLANLGQESVVVPSDREVLHASDELPPPHDDRLLLPPDTTVWLAMG